MSKTTIAKKETIERDWYLCDADNQIVGRLATYLATVLMGKHKPIYTPHVDCGDFVVVINADKIRFSGRPIAHPTHPYFTEKMLRKEYDHYTGYPSGRKIETAANLLERGHADRILQEAVRRMLPKNKIGRHMLSKLKIYNGDSHDQQAQQPQPLPDYLMP